MGKESRIRQERKSSGLAEKPQNQHRDRFPIIMRVVGIALAVILVTWGSLFALKSATGSIAYQVGTETVLQSDIDAQIQSYIDMYKQYGIDLTTEENVSMLGSIRKSVTNSAIEQQLYFQYAKSKNMVLDETKFKEAVDTEVENAVNQSKSQFGTDTSAFEDAVIAQYGSMDKFKAYIRTKVEPYIERQQLSDAVTAEIESSVVVTEADAKAYFESKGRVEADHLLILVDADKDSSSTIARKKATAQAIYDDIVNQKAANKTFDFAKYAQDKATELNNATADYAKYENLGFFTKGQMVAEFEAAAFQAKPGEIVSPIQTDFGFHIINVIAQEPVSTIYDTAETVKATHIAFAFGTGDKTEATAKAEADKVYAELQKGLSFASAISKYSTDSDAKDGGILDYFSQTSSQIRFDALAGLKQGQYTKPFVNGSSYEILRVVDRKPFVKASLSDKTTYDKVKSALESERKASAKTDLVAELKQQFPVRQGRWSRFMVWYNHGVGKVFSAIGNWIVKVTGKGATTETQSSQ